MQTLEEVANTIFIKLTDEPPTAEEQARMMASAFKALVEKNPIMEVEKIDKRYVQITGDSDQVKDQEISGYLGRAGEVVTYDAIETFLSEPTLREKWGTYAVEMTGSMLIPANMQEQDEVVSAYNNLAQQSFIQAKQEWEMNVHEKSITDFYMRNAYPIESKAKLEHRVFVSSTEGKKLRANDPERVRAKNPYIGELAKMGGKTVVGSVLFNVVFEEVAQQAMEEINRAVMNDLKRAARRKHNALVVSDLDFKGLENRGRLFKIVSMRISMFVPAVIDDKNFEQWLKGQVITNADQKANKIVSEFTTEMIDSLVKAYQSRK